jgi:serine/threonine protein kinase, bacterial
MNPTQSICCIFLSFALSGAQAADAPALPPPPPSVRAPTSAAGNGATAKTAPAKQATSPISLNNPRGLAVDPDGNIYIADVDSGEVYKMTPAGNLTLLAGDPAPAASAKGAAVEPGFSGPAGLALDEKGNVYVADGDNNLVRKISPAGKVSTLAGKVGEGGDTNGPGADARFQGPTGVAVDAKGNVFVADTHNGLIRKITPDGTVSTLAGKSGPDNALSVDGKDDAVRFGEPRAIAIDAAGVIYVADEQYGTVRKILPTGETTTLAGDATAITQNLPSKDGVGAKAVITSPRGVAVDAKGNVYVADTDNDAIRKITADGTVTTIAGKIGESGTQDGPGATARFSGPRGLAVDKDGNIYVADSDNGAIRKITPEGVVTTLGNAPVK